MVFLILKLVLGVDILRGVIGVLDRFEGLGEYEANNSEFTPNFNLDVANFLAAGDIAAKRSIVDVFGRGDGLKILQNKQTAIINSEQFKKLVIHFIKQINLR